MVDLLLDKVMQVDAIPLCQKKFFDSLLKRDLREALGEEFTKKSSKTKKVTLLKYLLKQFELEHEDPNKKENE